MPTPAAILAPAAPAACQTRRGESPAPVAILARGGPIDGSARQLTYLLRHLDRERFPPLVMLDIDGPLTEMIRATGVETCVMPMRPWRSLRGLPFRGRDARAIAARARAHGAAIVHCSDTWRGCYAASAARRLGVPLVVHVRGPVTSRDLVKNKCFQADAILAIAARYRDDVVAAGYPATRATIVNDAVDPDEYRHDAGGAAAFRVAHGSGRRLVVGMVGRLEPFKRVLELVDAVALTPRDLEVTFVLVGATTREPYVDQVRARIAARGVGDRFAIVGRRDDMAAVLSSLDVLATFSGGSVMFEAMSCGVPVLSVRPDGRHSQHTRHDDTAWCVTTDSPGPAAHAMATLLRDDALRARLGEAGRRYVHRHLSPAVMARQTEAIYASIVAAR